MNEKFIFLDAVDCVKWLHCNFSINLYNITTYLFKNMNPAALLFASFIKIPCFLA